MQRKRAALRLSISRRSLPPSFPPPRFSVTRAGRREPPRKLPLPRWVLPKSGKARSTLRSRPQRPQRGRKPPHPIQLQRDRVRLRRMQLPVMNQRAQLPALSAPTMLPIGSVEGTGTGNEPAAADSAPDFLGEASGTNARPSLPVAVAPWLVIPLPESGASLPVAPTPGATVTDPALSATQAPQALATVLATSTNAHGNRDRAARGRCGCHRGSGPGNRFGFHTC